MTWLGLPTKGRPGIHHPLGRLERRQTLLPPLGISKRVARPSPVVPAFALPNAEHHAGTVDVGDLQLTECGDAEAGRIERGEDDAVLQVMRHTQQCRDFRMAQNDGQG